MGRLARIIFLSALFLFGWQAFAQSRQNLPPAKNKISIARMNPFQAINVHSHAFHEVTAQFAHVGAGYGVVTGMRIAEHNTIGVSGMGGFVLAKEFWYDRKYEKQNLKENLRDTAFYGMGIGIAILQGSLKR